MYAGIGICILETNNVAKVEIGNKVYFFYFFAMFPFRQINENEMRFWYVEYFAECHLNCT